MPTLTCPNNAGPGDESLTAAAIARSTGERTASPHADAATSNTRLSFSPTGEYRASSLHLRNFLATSLTESTTYSISDAFMAGNIGSDTSRGHSDAATGKPDARYPYFLT